MSTKHMQRLIIPMMTFLMMGCAPTEPNELDKLGTVSMSISDQAFELWVANDSEERARGLMFITTEQMAPLSDGTERGMIFVFDHSVRGSFWMKNTIIPLDIAYVDSEGIVVSMYTMVPLDDRTHQYPPDAPYRYAIEFNGGRLTALDVRKGTKLKLPNSVLKRKP